MIPCFAGIQLGVLGILFIRIPDLSTGKVPRHSCIIPGLAFMAGWVQGLVRIS